jgi:hypothetical protein
MTRCTLHKSRLFAMAIKVLSLVLFSSAVVIIIYIYLHNAHMRAAYYPTDNQSLLRIRTKHDLGCWLSFSQDGLYVFNYNKSVSHYYINSKGQFARDFLPLFSKGLSFDNSGTYALLSMENKYLLAHNNKLYIMDDRGHILLRNVDMPANMSICDIMNVNGSIIISAINDYATYTEIYKVNIVKDEIELNIIRRMEASGNMSFTGEIIADSNMAISYVVAQLWSNGIKIGILKGDGNVVWYMDGLYMITEQSQNRWYANSGNGEGIAPGSWNYSYDYLAFCQWVRIYSDYIIAPSLRIEDSRDKWYIDMRKCGIKDNEMEDIRVGGVLTEGVLTEKDIKKIMEIYYMDQ